MTRCRWRGQDRGWLHISRQSSTLLRMWVPLPSYQVPSTLKREPKNHPGKREEVWGQIEAKKQMMRSFLTLNCHKPTDSSSADSKARSPCEASRGAALRRPGQRGHHCSCKEQPQANTEHCPQTLSPAPTRGKARSGCCSHSAQPWQDLGKAGRRALSHRTSLVLGTALQDQLWGFKPWMSPKMRFLSFLP